MKSKLQVENNLLIFCYVGIVADCELLYFVGQ